MIYFSYELFHNHILFSDHCLLVCSHYLFSVRQNKLIELIFSIRMFARRRICKTKLLCVSAACQCCVSVLCVSVVPYKPRGITFRSELIKNGFIGKAPKITFVRDVTHGRAAEVEQLIDKVCAGLPPDLDHSASRDLQASGSVSKHKKRNHLLMLLCDYLVGLIVTALAF